MTGQPAFLLLAHASPRAVARLAERLAPRRVFLHVDGKVPAEAFAEVAEKSEVQIVSSIRVHWASFSMVRATVALLRAALASGEKFSKLVMLSETSYPIRPLVDIDRIFAGTGSEQIRYVQITAGTPALAPLVRRRWFMEPVPGIPARIDKPARRLATKVAQVRQARFADVPGGLRPFFGSQWWALTPACARQVLVTYESCAELRRFYSHRFAPDEQYIPTIVANSRFASPDQLGHYDGQETYRQSATHFIPPANDRTLRTVDDLRQLSRSGRPFVRKVTLESTQVRDAIDAQLLGL